MHERLGLWAEHRNLDRSLNKILQCLTVVLLAAVVSGQFNYDSYVCPPENSWVAKFRNLTDVREPLTIPYVCCACLLADDCPVVGRCVETDYQTVQVVAYCPHLMYSDRFVKLALRIPTNCRCAAQCPVPDEYIFNQRDGDPREFGQPKQIAM